MVLCCKATPLHPTPPRPENCAWGDCLGCYLPSLPLQLQAAQARLSYLEQAMVERSIVSRQEALICDLESKMEFQSVQIKRFEVERWPYWGGGGLPGQGLLSFPEAAPRRCWCSVSGTA